MNELLRFQVSTTKQSYYMYVCNVIAFTVRALLHHMELMKKDNLHVIAQKTLNLHDKISEEINKNGFVFCSHCSNHGKYCAVADVTEEERDKMIAIRDSLRQVYEDLLYLQRINSDHERKRDECYGRLDQSRKFLIEKVQQFPEKEIKLDVVEELAAFLEDVEQTRTLYPPLRSNKNHNLEVNTMNNADMEKGGGFLAKTTRFAFEFGVMFATIYSTVVLCKNIKQLNNNNDSNSYRLSSDSASSSINGGLGVLQLDVLCGRG